MSGLGQRLVEALADRAGPIVVKELRQGLRARVFWVFFGLLLVACLAVALAFAATSASGSSTLGRDAFRAFVVCLAVVEFLVVPYSAYRSMAREREEETWVLLVLTGLGPRRILSGKIRSFVAQGALYACAAGPFLVFSYLLNGVDLVTILVALLCFALAHPALVLASVAVATMGTHRVARGLLHFLLLGGLLFTAAVATPVLLKVSETAMNIFDENEAWLAAGAACAALVTSAAVLFELGVAQLTLATENGARGVRVAWLVQLGALVGVFGLIALVEHEAAALAAGSVVASVYVAVVGTLVLADVDGMAANHWRSAGRWALLRPGALRGYALQLLGFLGAPGLLGAAYWLSTVPKWSEYTLMIFMLGLGTFYAALPQIVARWLARRPDATPGLARLAFVAVLVLIGGGTPLLSLALTGETDTPVINALNPFFAVFILDGSLHGSAFPWQALLTMQLVAGLGATLWALAVLVRRDRAPPSPSGDERRP